MMATWIIVSAAVVLFLALIAAFGMWAAVEWEHRRLVAALRARRRWEAVDMEEA